MISRSVLTTAAKSRKPARGELAGFPTHQSNHREEQILPLCQLSVNMSQFELFFVRPNPV